MVIEMLLGIHLKLHQEILLKILKTAQITLLIVLAMATIHLHLEGIMLLKKRMMMSPGSLKVTFMTILITIKNVV